MNKRLMTDMADANGLQRAIRPTGFFNIKKTAADFCSAQCIMDNTVKALVSKETAVLCRWRSELDWFHGFS